jgi:hypothetical protein
MGFLGKSFGTGEGGSDNLETGSANLAFVLLSEAHLPKVEAIVQAFRQFADDDEYIQPEEDNSKDDAHERIVTLKFNTGERSFVGLMPIAIPDREADTGAQFSMSAIGKGWNLPPHRAHLVVTFQSRTTSTPITHLSRFTSLLAAVTKTSPAVGVYWGNAGATHDPEFFTTIAPVQNGFFRLMLWSGVSMAREKDGRVSLLSLGMGQLNLPNLLVVAGKASEEKALETLYDLLCYIAETGEALPEGDTVGLTADQKLLVRHVPSPVDSAVKVMRIDLP